MTDEPKVKVSAEEFARILDEISGDRPGEVVPPLYDLAERVADRVQRRTERVAERVARGMPFLTPNARITCITVMHPALMNTDLPDRHDWSIKVEDGLAYGWAVRWMRDCYAADGTREYEPSPSNRDDDWFARYRHDLPTALAIADRAVRELRINGMTGDDYLARYEGTDRG